MRILGHRGINQPENKNLPYQNTIRAFEYAFGCDADGIELDIIVSKDGKCFVIHDDEIAKHGGTGGLITALDSSDIKKQKIGPNHDSEIPTLQEVFELLKPKNKFLNIEIKQEGIAEQVVNEIKISKFPLENLLVSSFNHHDLHAVREMDKDIYLGILFGRESREKEHYESYLLNLADRLGHTAFNPEKTLPYLGIWESPREKFVWTIKLPDLTNNIVDGLLMFENVNLFTDYPKELRAKLAAK